ncbi:low molecular weight protein-tyrosine-phosphatase [Psychrobacter fozii]|uniref:protein-tyrosine-phosphatase n=1 Tax=Psychrobacter fozii TaxID=198480 RepID=A0A2V4V230_9GAMM|nr:low molecular weight protein-tyrosine-phosphatase [Psychrobacter fozii]PYE40112.1 protein tyrosine phosphatase [Psychrobacter fozii]
MNTFDSILVVCVGNICRSPMAAAILTERYPDRHVDSAGLSALVGHFADIKAIELMTIHDIDISSHIAKPISEALVSHADLILTMTTSQTKWIENRWPHCRGRIFRIGHWIDKDIVDPYQQDKSVFETSRQDIDDSLEQWAIKMSQATEIKELKVSECY